MATNDLPRKVRLQTLASAIAAFPPAEPPSMQPILCAYCSRTLAHPRYHSKDHVVPRWVTRAFPEDFPPGPYNYVIVCAACNHRKANLPVAVYFRLRHNPKALKEQHSFWAGIGHRVMNMKSNHPDYESLRATTVTAFSERVESIDLPRLPPPDLVEMMKMSRRAIPMDKANKKKRRPIYRLGGALLDEDYQIGKRI